MSPVKLALNPLGSNTSRLVFHDLRRTFATGLRAADVHPYDIADLLGHSVPKGETKATRVTKGYARAVPQRLREAVSKLEKGKLLTFFKPQKVAGDVEKVRGHHRGIKRARERSRPCLVSD